MALDINSLAPNFTASITPGQDFTLRQDLKGKPCLIYFYPQDFTTVCTLEACGFRDTFDFFKAQNLTVIGISRDNIQTHNDFKVHYELPFELIADEDGKVSDLYDATAPFVAFTKRITYLINVHHRIVGVWSNIHEDPKGIKTMIEEVIEQSKIYARLGFS